MKKEIILKQIIGFVFTGVFGVLLHYAYEWSGENKFVAIFSGVNESTFEHMKLLFFPMLAYAFIEERLSSKTSGFWCKKMRGILAGIISIPVIFYTANGVFGKTADWFNILIFFISAGVGYALETKLFYEKKGCQFEKVSKAILLILALLFAVFTFFPPPINLFRDPLTKLYGI